MRLSRLRIFVGIDEKSRGSEHPPNLVIEALAIITAQVMKYPARGDDVKGVARLIGEEMQRVIEHNFESAA